jgi:hypothetical protein
MRCDRSAGHARRLPASESTCICRVMANTRHPRLPQCQLRSALVYGCIVATLAAASWLRWEHNSAEDRMFKYDCCLSDVWQVCLVGSKARYIRIRQTGFVLSSPATHASIQCSTVAVPLPIWQRVMTLKAAARMLVQAHVTPQHTVYRHSTHMVKTLLANSNNHVSRFH